MTGHAGEAATPAGHIGLPQRTVIAILTSHDRRELTLTCLRSFFAQDAPGVALRAVLVDDGSSDGTADAVAREFPLVDVVPASGDLFWARGMAAAEAVAVTSAPDFLLWLNEDVSLYRDAVRRLMAVAEANSSCAVIVSGAVSDPETGATTYGGVRRRDWHPMRYDLVEPGSAPTVVDTVNGNVLLVPRRSYELLGGIDNVFEHSYADFDYGLRLRRAGGKALLTDGFVGTCALNDWHAIQVHLDPSVPLSARWRFLRGRKGRPLRSQVHYLRRHGGPLWPVFLIPPYVRSLAGRPPPDRHPGSVATPWR